MKNLLDTVACFVTRRCRRRIERASTGRNDEKKKSEEKKSNPNYAEGAPWPASSRDVASAE